MTARRGAGPMGALGPAAPTPLSIDRLTIHYPGRKEAALDEVAVAVRAGERVGVAGRTGAGKSTLALAAAGFIPRVVRADLSGRVAIAGVDTSTATSADLLGKVGIVFATPANQLSASKLTVREELAFGLENLGVPRAEMDPRIDSTLDRLGISHLADREPFALSSGEQQRVAIASIIAMGTGVLVLDESTAQLDPAGTAAVADLLEELTHGGVAILCVAHDPVVLGRMDRCLVLDAGLPVALDFPGGALARAEAVLGLPAPTLVRLAIAAGIDPVVAFDEAAMAAALLAGIASGSHAWVHSGGHAGGHAGHRLAAPTNAVGSGPVWTPGRERPSIRMGIEDLSYRYPTGVEAVRGVTLTIEPGEAVAILGQNGSGKTTLVKHLNGLLRPTEGRVLLGGEPTNDRSVAQLAATVGSVFQNPDEQLFERSVEREVGFGPRNLGVPAATVSALVANSLAAVGLLDQRATNPYDLDLSRRKLVALAGVLAMDPAVLVLDEPTTGQDADGVARVGAVVEAYRRAGRSVITITHDVEFAATHFGRIVLMRQGEIIADGTPADVFAPENRDLLASTGLNPPPAARIAARLHLTTVPLDVAGLLVALAGGR